jgi:hypothetical protein
MLAKKLSPADELPTRPLNARPTPRPEASAIATSYHLPMSPPSPTLRSLAWADHWGASGLDLAALESMLRLERLNLG